MLKRIVSGILLTALLSGMLALAFNIQTVKASETITIRADGSIDPPTTPISSIDNITYTFTDNIYDSIVIERNNIVLNGAGHIVQGTGAYGSIGILLSSVSNVTIKDTNIKVFYYGIYINNTSYNVIFGNGITETYGDCIYLFYSSSNCICRNNLTLNYGGSVHLRSSNYNIISENRITTNWVGLALFESSNNSISGNSITNNKVGLYLRESLNNSLCWNNVTANSGDGVVLEFSSNNNLFGNTITANGENGLSGAGSFKNTISRNKITANNGFGIKFSISSNNSIYENSITNNNDIGVIFFYYSNYNSISKNNITNNKYYGIYFSYRNFDNRIYHNNFINNTKQAASDDSPNIWDDNYPSGGNYWSDYHGVDTTGDGIGDAPYIIYADNQDRYPLIKPYVPLFGDLNDDRKVDLKDIALAARAFGETLDRPRWNPQADVNKDNKIDMKDLAIIAKNFGKTYP